MLNNENGFSIVEVILVLVILSIITIISIPWLWKAIGAARNGNAYASLKTISSVQLSYYAKNNRFARLDELNSETNDTLGVMDGANLVRGKFTLSMNPVTPSNNDLRGNFEIIASKPASANETPCVLAIDGSGIITELFGTNCIDND